MIVLTILLIFCIGYVMWKSSKCIVAIGLIWFFVLGAPGCHRERREAYYAPSIHAAECAPLPLSHDDPNDVLETYGPLAHERGW